jgi:hypothetical protein
MNHHKKNIYALIYYRPCLKNPSASLKKQTTVLPRLSIVKFKLWRTLYFEKYLHFLGK